MPSKREVLGLLTRDELLAAVAAFDLEVQDRRVRDQLIEAVAASKRATIAAVLTDYSRDRLKELCRALSLDDGGREKAVLVERLSGARKDEPLVRAYAPSPEALIRPVRQAAAGASGGRTDAVPPTSAPRPPQSAPEMTSFIWSVADLLRGDYKQSEYGKVILPFTVLRRLDCVLEETKGAVLAEKDLREKAGLNPEPFLLKKAKQHFYNTSPLDLKTLKGDQDHIGENLRAYVQGFSAPVRDIFERFEFHTQIDRLGKAGLLYLVTEKFAGINLHPDVVSNAEMGLVFEELIRKFAELSNETAGEHFTPREVIRLMVNLIFIEDDDALAKPGVVRSLYDPT